MTTRPAAKDAVRRHVEAAAEALVACSHRIHAYPELGYEEERAAAWLTELLAEHGMAVETGVADLPTAFVARAGSGPLHVAICAEYDALPEIGHVCGHNVIGTAAVGAGLALARVADDVGLTVSVMGTPAEEGGGGKVLMLERGVFAGVHAAMMVHPAPVESLTPMVRAAGQMFVDYHGHASHAAIAPYEGVNAADAMVVAQTAIGLLRQQLRPGELVHGIVTHGGDAFNVIPAHTSGHWMVRADTLEDLAGVRERVTRCFEAGALAAGCGVTVERRAPDYAEMRHDAALLERYRANAEAAGRRIPDDAPPITFSTDMGNVSRAIPSIHPTVAIESDGAVNHQPEFAAACATPSADRALLEGALAMAWTAIDLAEPGPLHDRLLGRA